MLLLTASNIKKVLSTEDVREESVDEIRQLKTCRKLGKNCNPKNFCCFGLVCRDKKCTKKFGKCLCINGADETLISFVYVPLKIPPR